MAVSSRLKFGQLSNFVGWQNNTRSTSFNRFTSNIISGDTTLTNVTFSTGKGWDYIIPGQIIEIATGGTPTFWASTVVSSNESSAEIIIADPPPFSNTNRITFLYPQKGLYYFESGSLTVPNNVGWDINDVTGSNDSFYQEGENKWGIFAQLAFTSSTVDLIGGVFGQYEIYKTYYRTPTLLSFYITSSNGPLFEDPDKVIGGSSFPEYIPLVELTQEESLATIFNPDDLSIQLNTSYGVAAYQASIQTFDLNLGGGTSAFPYTGSAQITGSLGVTGSVEFNTQVGGTDFFILKSGSVENFKINGEGIAQFYAYPNDYTPTPVLGGLFFQTSSAWVGLE